MIVTLLDRSAPFGPVWWGVCNTPLQPGTLFLRQLNVGVAVATRFGFLVGLLGLFATGLLRLLRVLRILRRVGLFGLFRILGSLRFLRLFGLLLLRLRTLGQEGFP